MMKNIHFFAAGEATKDKAGDRSIGIRGQRAMELASIDLPILPGFIIDAEIAADLEKVNLQADLKGAMAKIEKIVQKKFGDATNPMLVKIVISPNMVIVNYPTLHNFGLCNKNLAAFMSLCNSPFNVLMASWIALWSLVRFSSSAIFNSISSVPFMRNCISWYPKFSPTNVLNAARFLLQSPKLCSVG